MLFRRKGTNLYYDVKEHLVALYKGNEAYELVENDVTPVKEEVEKPKTRKVKK